ncbi:Transcriptional regulator MraZ [Alphaproteobacteria bacterium SO-S41]|nr:Transcriptional regulator MraZ [Alphaproteobacteria bacterium SO-S41]
MSKFYSNFEKQIDAKGRVSVPAPFRASVSALGGDRIYCFPSFVDAAIECYPPPAYFALLERIEGIVESPEAREQLELAVITRGVELAFDGEGRVMLPERLLKAVGIEKAITFAGRGDRFQIWAPEEFARIEAEAMAKAAQYRHLLLTGAKSPAIPAAPKSEGVL